MAEYRTHSFTNEWHDKVEEFIEENDLAFDSPKYFIKFCVNMYMEEHGSGDMVSRDAVFDALSDELGLSRDELRDRLVGPLKDE